VRALLVSTYDLGRQPLGLASPAARLAQVGVDVRAVDVSREPLLDGDIAEADAVAFYLPMHTATRLAMPLVDRVRVLNPRARLAAYGLYAPLNASWLRDRGIAHVFGPNDERALVDLLATATSAVDLAGADAAVAATRETPAPASTQAQTAAVTPVRQSEFVTPDRSVLLPLARYAALQMPDGTRRVVGHTDATHGCKHLCRHCPIVPVYHGTFRAVPLDIVLADVRSQVEAGALHITFGDPDFFNGPTHARRLVEAFARQHPGVSYDVTIKIEHLLNHADLLPVLRDTGCLFVTSAVESIDDAVLDKLRKGHTRAGFVRAVGLCREAGLSLSPTFVPFTPWTTLDGYRELLGQIASLDLVGAVAPIQLGIRLLVTAESALLELPDIRAAVAPFDPTALVWPWQHADPRVDALQREVMRLASDRALSSREETFAAIARAAGAHFTPETFSPGAFPLSPVPAPYMTEAWYCCAEPGAEQLDTV
jgi:radical SAM superfamily enzyme YgiQ (UPF0313 family)